MIHALPSFPEPFKAAATVVRSRFGWAVWASFVAAAACAAAVIANATMVGRLPASGEPAGMATPREKPNAAERALLPALPEGAGKAARMSRCQGCGVVEAIRRIEPAGSVPAGYEFTIRLRDGSTRVSSDANPARWHIGDSIMLIGGAEPPVR